MIATIEGQIAEKIGDSIIIELGGVGYELAVTVTDWSEAKVGQPSKYYIYEHIREDAHQLFGFSLPAARQLFVKLLGVSGIGPKVAMQVMSAASLDRLQQAIATGDADLFKGVSGVGKKTAERIMVELRGKVEVGSSSGQVGSQDAAYQALIGLGYSAPQAADAVAKIPADITDDQARVKEALKQVS